MPTLASSKDIQQLGKQFLSGLSSILSELSGEIIRGFTALQLASSGSTSGEFITPKRDRYSFTVEGENVRYRRVQQKMDSAQVGNAIARIGIPIPLSGDDAYSTAFLQSWFREDAKKCGRGTQCGGTCIESADECRLTVRSPQMRRNLKSLNDLSRILHRSGAAPVIVPIAGALGIAAVGLVVGMAIGGHMGASAARQPTPEPTPKVVREPRKRKKNYPQPPDPWEGAYVAPKATVSVKPQEQVEQQELDLSTPETTPSPANAGVVTMNVADIKLAPKLFQYKLPNDISSRATTEFKQQGTTGALSDVEVWNPQVAGALKVWQVPEAFSLNGESFDAGDVVLVHGHHRLALAKRAGAIADPDPTKPPTPGTPDQVKVEFLNASNWKQARLIGAMENIALGSGTARDAANLFRELGVNDPNQLKSQGISMRSAIAEQGLGLAGLNDRLWNKVTDPANTEMSDRRAAYIGGIRNSDLQDEVWETVKTSKNVTDEYVKSMAQTVQHQLETGQIEVRGSEGQGTLFDMQQTVANLKDRVEMDAYIESQISKEASFWARAANPTRLLDLLSKEQAGDIDLQRSKAVSDQTAIARYLYQRGKFIQSDQNYTQITDALIQAGNELRALRDRGAKKKEVDAFKQSTYQRIRDLLAEGMERS